MKQTWMGWEAWRYPIYLGVRSYGQSHFTNADYTYVIVSSLLLSSNLHCELFPPCKEEVSSRFVLCLPKLWNFLIDDRIYRKFRFQYKCRTHATIAVVDPQPIGSVCEDYALCVDNKSPSGQANSHSDFNIGSAVAVGTTFSTTEKTTHH
jgi:hypothetical protein